MVVKGLIILQSNSYFSKELTTTFKGQEQMHKMLKNLNLTSILHLSFFSSHTVRLTVLALASNQWNQIFADNTQPYSSSCPLALPCLCLVSFSSYLADDGELRSVDVVTINPQREHCSQSHHAAHRCHVVQVRLRVLDVAVTDSHRDKKQTHSGNYYFCLKV